LQLTGFFVLQPTFQTASEFRTAKHVLPPASAPPASKAKHNSGTDMKQKIWYTYDDIHRVIKNLAEKIQAAGIKYDAMIAIGGGGFIPARMLRCFLEIPIYAVTTAYYDSDNEGQVTEEIKKVQWLDPVPEVLEGKNVLVVDEVDDSRVTMEFCLNELLKEKFNTVGVAVLHEKIKAKTGKIPDGIPYFSGLTVEDLWINYPWDAENIDEHNRLAAESKR